MANKGAKKRKDENEKHMAFLRNLILISAVLLNVAALATCYSQFEYVSLITELSQKKEYRDDYANNVRKLLEQDPDYFAPKFTNRLECKDAMPAKPSANATSVHKLTPFDIGIVAALGDSLTAAAGAEANDADCTNFPIPLPGYLCNMAAMLYEGRGISWSIGGNADLDSVLTLPNILKKFNPNLRGFSTEKNVVGFQDAHPGRGLNVAVSGSEANNMPGQARMLVDKLKAMPNYQHEWKLVTLFIGGNDGCRACKNWDYYHQDNYVHHIQQALDILHDNLPKTLVNLVPVLDISLVGQLTSGLFCSTLHNRFCSCGAYPDGPQALQEIQLLIKKYQAGVESLVNSGKYDNRDDFTVVIQPFLKDMTIPLTPFGRPDYTYFAPDCFHFSTKAQGESAAALFNNMLQKVGHKQTEWDIGSTVKCPTPQAPYFFTNKNSN